MNEPTVTRPLSDCALISDCDGVLINSEAFAEHVIVTRLERLWGLAGLRDVVRPMLGMRAEALLRTVGAVVDRQLDDETIEAIRDDAHASAVNAPAIAGVRDALSAIPLVKACASNSDLAYVRSVVGRIGLANAFGERLFTADQVPSPKPAPDVYLSAARHMQVAPERCIVVEDSATGTAAAIAAGMTVLGFVGAAHAARTQADKLRAAGVCAVFDDMDALPSLVDAWLRQIPGTTPASRPYA
ncbi:HAD-IA family hydrolase [Burkholderia sp. Ac-20344]|uniref:HAD family hydrolase n=1 Tax=Burkholderia sp. Ac-20344 TaxID=2703890 RepID=UPI00197B5D6B|nr:HAD-IA family hydrolase [Burkholderia sp. Ac-20344]MBN3831896.1 HAD-IA family hydrolase [Burkholderia sp. Ac-20344]